MKKYINRLEDIANMKKNWTLDKEEGIEAPTDEAIMEAKNALNSMVKYASENNYYIYPSMKSGISIEWSKNQWECSIEVSSDGKSYEFLAVDMKSSDYIDNSKLKLTDNFEVDLQQFLMKVK